MPTLMGHQNHGFLARCIPYPPEPPLLQLLGCREPKFKSQTPKLAHFCTQKALGTISFTVVAEGAAKLLGIRKQS